MDTESSCHLGKVRLKKAQEWWRKREFGKAISFSLPPSPLYSTQASYWYKGSKHRMRRVLCTALPPFLKPQPEAPVLCPWRTSVQMPFWRHPECPVSVKMCSLCESNMHLIVEQWLRVLESSSSGAESKVYYSWTVCAQERDFTTLCLSFLIDKIGITIEHSSQWYSEDWIKLSKMI